MAEISGHRAYRLLEEKYDRVCLDYVILRADGEYSGAETHRRAVMEAFEILNGRFADFDYAVHIRPDRMAATKSTISELLALPPEDFRRGAYTIEKPIPYWYAFLNPPQGTPYGKEDFRDFNEVLFPNRENMEVYRWNDDFSDYFDAGREWWGTGLWSAIDRKTGVAVIIGASLTD